MVNVVKKAKGMRDAAVYNQWPHRLLVLPMMALASGGNGGTGGADIETFLCKVSELVGNLTFIGAIGGLLFYGLIQIYEIFNPQAGGQTREYLKKLAIGIAIIALAAAIVSAVFDALGLSHTIGWSCSTGE